MQSLVASTLNITNDDFLAGKYTFQRTANTPAAGITNQGHLQATETIALLGGAVRNTGSIQAPDVGLAVGDQITLNLSPEVGLGITVTQSVKDKVAAYQSAIANNGTITSSQVQLQAQLNQALYETTVNNTGIVRASGLSVDASGQIVAVAHTDDHQAIVNNTGQLIASGNNAHPNGGSIQLQSDFIQQQGQILTESAATPNSAPIATGGTIALQGDQQVFLDSGSITSANGGQGGQVQLTGQAMNLNVGSQAGGGQITVHANGVIDATSEHQLNASGATHGGSIRQEAAGLFSSATYKADGHTGGVETLRWVEILPYWEPILPRKGLLKGARSMWVGTGKGGRANLKPIACAWPMPTLSPQERI